MLQLGELNLQLALERSRPLGEDIKDKSGTIDYPTLQQAFEIAFLCRRELVVDQHHIGLMRDHEFTQFLSLAATYEVTRIGTVTIGADSCDRCRTRRSREFSKLVEIRRAEPVLKYDVNEDCALARLGAFKQSGSPW